MRSAAGAFAPTREEVGVIPVIQELFPTTDVVKLNAPPPPALPIRTIASCAEGVTERAANFSATGSAVSCGAAVTTFSVTGTSIGLWLLLLGTTTWIVAEYFPFCRFAWFTATVAAVGTGPPEGVTVSQLGAAVPGAPPSTVSV